MNKTAQGREDGEPDEDAPVALAHAVVDEGAVVVQVQHTAVAAEAVRGGLRLVAQADRAQARVGRVHVP